MKKILMITSSVALGLTLLTGCSDKVAINPNTNNETSKANETKKENNQENKVTEQNSSGNSKETPNSVSNSQNSNAKQGSIQFDFNKVDEITNLFSYQTANFKDSSTPAMIVLIENARFTPDTINKVSMSRVVDLLNTYNSQTFNSSDVLYHMRNQKAYDYQEIDGYLKDYPETNAVWNSNGAKMIYFTKDNVFAMVSHNGVGGASSLIKQPQSEWKVDGDKILVPFKDFENGQVKTMTLKLNNKNYVGGANKTMYYVESFK